MARSEHSAGFILFHRGGPSPAQAEFLLLDYGRHWDFAKGHVKKGEDDWTAARRELQEETGIVDVNCIPNFRREIVYFFLGRKRGLVRKSVVFFMGETGSRDVVLSPEHVGFAFLPFDAALVRVTFASAKQVLRDAHAHLEALSSAPAARGDTAS